MRHGDADKGPPGVHGVAPFFSAAFGVLERTDGLRVGSRLVFPGIQGKMVAAAVFGRLLKDLGIDCSPHGFRSSFRSWCSVEGVDRELAEQALAHAVGSQVEQCYARSDALERRRGLVEARGAERRSEWDQLAFRGTWRHVVLVPPAPGPNHPYPDFDGPAHAVMDPRLACGAHSRRDSLETPRSCAGLLD